MLVIIGHGKLPILVGQDEQSVRVGFAVSKKTGKGGGIRKKGGDLPINENRAPIADKHIKGQQVVVRRPSVCEPPSPRNGYCHMFT